MRVAFLLAFSIAVSSFAAVESTNAEVIKPAERIAQKFLSALDANNEDTAESMAYERELKIEPSGRVIRRTVVSGRYLVESRKIFGRVKSRKLVRTEVIKEFFGLPAGLFRPFHVCCSVRKARNGVHGNLDDQSRQSSALESSGVHRRAMNPAFFIYIGLILARR